MRMLPKRFDWFAIGFSAFVYVLVGAGLSGAFFLSALLQITISGWYWVILTCIALAVATLAAFGNWKLAQSRDRRAKGLCPHCGYDLRASPDRCPECGRKTRPPVSPSPSSTRRT